MAPPADERPASTAAAFGALLAPFPGRLAFAARLALVCALTTLVAQIYQTPEPALTAYVAFFVMKPDRAESVVASVVMLLLITVIIGVVLALTVPVIDRPLGRVAVMALLSFCLTFAASASKLKPVAGTVALITAYALDLLGTVPGGETATRGFLYVWLFVGIPAGICILVNLLIGPAPRRLAEQALAHRLRLAGAMLRGPGERTREAFGECLREGAGEIPAWLKLAGAEKTSPAHDLAALQQATQSTVVILAMVDFVASGPAADLPVSVGPAVDLPVSVGPAVDLPVSMRARIADTFDEMAAIFAKGGYPVDIALARDDDEAAMTAEAAAALAELRMALSAFAQPPAPDPTPEPAAKPKGGFFLPDAFTDPAHVQYALKTTGAAMFCYIVYLLLDWPGIHTCLITCYIVSLGTAAETAEKQVLRLLGCVVGAAAGTAAIVFLMPHVTSIGGLMGVVFLAALVSGWIAAGGPRISYVGFQLAFAFFLAVIQGSAPAFDMTIARDRTIGILFGDLVVTIVFTLLWPVSIAGRIDPALAALFRTLADLAAATRRPRRWALAVEARTRLGAVEQDLDLARYEPASIRPAEAWLDRRREIAHAASSLLAPLLIGRDRDALASAAAERRLDRLATRFGAGAGSSAHAIGSGAVAVLVEPPLARLEQLVAQPSEPETEGRVDYAPA
jgi:multidrug resistance protein MdtO